MSVSGLGLRVGEKAHTHCADRLETGRRKDKSEASTAQPCDTFAFKDHEACSKSSERKHTAGWSWPVMTVALRRLSANALAEQNAKGFLIPSNSCTR